MSVSLNTLLNSVNRYIKLSDLNLISADDKLEIINDSVNEYSDRRPHRVAYEATGNSNGQYELPSNYENGFSYIIEIESPINSQPKEIVNPQHYFLDYLPSGQVLRFNYSNPSNGDPFYIKYTARHWFETDGVSTIPTSDQSGIVYLCVSNICNVLANYYANRANVNLTEAEPFQYDSRVTEYREQANTFFRRYEREIKQEFTGFHGEIDFLQGSYFDRNDD